jgi:hypothetical protein
MLVLAGSIKYHIVLHLSSTPERLRIALILLWLITHRRCRHHCFVHVVNGSDRIHCQCLQCFRWGSSCCLRCSRVQPLVSSKGTYALCTHSSLIEVRPHHQRLWARGGARRRRLPPIVSLVVTGMPLPSQSARISAAWTPRSTRSCG